MYYDDILPLRLRALGHFTETVRIFRREQVVEGTPPAESMGFSMKYAKWRSPRAKIWEIGENYVSYNYIFPKYNSKKTRFNI